MKFLHRDRGMAARKPCDCAQGVLPTQKNPGGRLIKGW